MCSVLQSTATMIMMMTPYRRCRQLATEALSGAVLGHNIWGPGRSPSLHSPSLIYLSSSLPFSSLSSYLPFLFVFRVFVFRRLRTAKDEISHNLGACPTPGPSVEPPVSTIGKLPWVEDRRRSDSPGQHLLSVLALSCKL